jgi:hypothetical protein
MSGRQRSISFVLGGFALLCALAVPAARADNGPQVSPNVQVNTPQQLFPNDWPSRNTTTLASSAEGDNLLAGWDDFQGFCGAPNNRACPPQSPPGLSGYGFSTDGGATWTDGGSPPRIGATWTSGHSWVDRGGSDGQETFYFTTRMRASANPNDSQGIGIFRGHFGAGTFVWDDNQIISSPNPAGDFYGRQAIAAAKDGSGAAYIVLSNVDEICGVPLGGYGQIEVWRTHDAGATWQGPVVVSPDAANPNDPADPNCGATGYQQVAPDIAVGPGGEVYAVWQHGPFLDEVNNASPDSTIGFARSLDGGVTFSAPQLLVDFNNNRANPPVGYAKNRLNDQPRITVATSGQYRGRIYVTFYSPVAPVAVPAGAQSSVSTQSYILYSDDQGLTWSAPQAIAPAVPATGVKRIWPTATVRPGGDLDVVYLESRETQATADPSDVECSVAFGPGLFRNGPLSSLVDTYQVESHDGGATFSAPLRISSATGNWCKAAFGFSGGLFSNFGDYIGVASGGDRTFALWPDGRNDFADVFFATVKGKDK